MFTKRTIRPERNVTSVDTSSEALAVSIGERGKVDLPYMAELLGTPGDYGRITTELSGVIFKDPAADPTDPEAGWQMADEYLSGDVRAKLRMAQFAAETNPEFVVNVDALTKAQPRELEASEIDVRLGATCSNNLNQYAKAANENGRVYAADMEDLRQRLDELIDIGRQILSRLAEL